MADSTLTPGHAAAFRAQLVKIMPGYKWTVHRCRNPAFIKATGIRSSGFNRLSTLKVVREETERYGVTFRACLAGHGTKAIFGPEFVGPSIARALRDLQNHYVYTAATYRNLASQLEQGRAG